MNRYLESYSNSYSIAGVLSFLFKCILNKVISIMHNMISKHVLTHFFYFQVTCTCKMTIVLARPKGCTESLDRKVVPKVSTERLNIKSK